MVALIAKNVRNSKRQRIKGEKGDSNQPTSCDDNNNDYGRAQQFNDDKQTTNQQATMTILQ